MKTYVVFFRGVNVGGKNILPMKQLVLLLEGAGYKNVKNYIQSGNIVLQAQSHPQKKIHELVALTFSINVNTLVMEVAQFMYVLDNNPYTSCEGKTVHFYLCDTLPAPNTEKIARYLAPTETYTLNETVLYLHAPEGIGRSKLVANIERCLGTTITGRNLNTMLKIKKIIDDIAV